MRPESLRNGQIMLFREGVKPYIEDEANRAGAHAGKLSFKVRKGASAQLWEALVLALIGEALGAASADVCGAFMQLRYQDDTFSLWHRCADAEAVAALRCVRAQRSSLPHARRGD